MGKPLVMRLELNQQSSGAAYGWHRNLIGSLIPIVDCGVHYVDVMCQLTGARPVRVHGIGAKLWDEAARQNYGHLHVTFDDGSVGWYEAGWGPMMSETAYFVKDVVGPLGSVSIVAGQAEAVGEGGAPSGSADIDRHTRTDALRIHRAEVDPETHEFVHRDEIVSMEDEPGPPGSVRPRAGPLPARDPGGSGPRRVDGGPPSAACASVLAAERSIEERRSVELA